MYNMDITILGYKFNIQILILIGVVYLILVGHTVGGCCNFRGLMEGNTTMGQSNNSNSQTDTSENMVKDKIKQKMQGNMPTQTTAKEGFVGANINYVESSAYDLKNNMPVNTASWSAQNMTVVPGQPLSEGVKKFLARPKQQLPLPEGEMLLFANTKFAPEFCPNTYSNSSGCAAMSGEDYNYLITRGGNNVPYSEY